MFGSMEYDDLSEADLLDALKQRLRASSKIAARKLAAEEDGRDYGLQEVYLCRLHPAERVDFVRRVTIPLRLSFVRAFLRMSL